MKLLVVILWCCGSAVLALGMTNDILYVPSEVLSRIENAVWTELLMDGLVTASVVDICVVGSFAQGCARVKSGCESDLDIAIFVPQQRLIKASFGRRVAQRSGIVMTFDVSVQLTNRMQKNNSDWIAFSLLDRKMYGRPGGTPRYVKLLWSEGRWCAIPRECYEPAERHRQMSGSVIFLRDNILKCVHPASGTVLTSFPALTGFITNSTKVE